MAITQRTYDKTADFPRVSAFLAKHYRPQNRDGNWFPQIWEYSYFLYPRTDLEGLEKIGIWESGGEMVGVTVFDTDRCDLSLNTHPEFKFLRNEMLAYAEKNLWATDEDNRRFIRIFAADFEQPYTDLLANNGYRHVPERDRAMSQFVIPENFPQPVLPDGYRFKSLADEYDLRKIHTVLHRGFNHPGEPPLEGIWGLERREKRHAGPNTRYDLTMVIETPAGDYATYCGMYYDKTNTYGYVEPVATDPDYRRRGLGTATVLESIRRCGEQGATVAYVWTDMPFYLSFGFKKIFTYHCWVKHL